MPSSTSPPRVLHVELERDRARLLAPELRAPSRWPGARLGGIVEGLRALHEAAEAGAEAPFVVAVGEAVRRGLPTAARASVLARAPLTGRLGLGQIGGELGPRLASVADALVVRGRATLPGAVLLVDEARAPELHGLPELVGRAPAAAAELLRARFGQAGMLIVGPAGERGVAFASLASEGERPSFVGRGGLGAVLAGKGLKAIVVRGALARVESSPRAHALSAALARSPRLAARSEGGTFELLAAHAARGELWRADGVRVADEAARALQEAAQAQARERKGCRGCPTPCGWVFERADGARQQAHFGAAEALGTRLGLTQLDDALALLAACDAAGCDAKETGGVLAVLESARRAGRWPGPSALGDRARLLADLAALLAPEAPGFLGQGAAAAARALGVAAPLAEPEASGPERGRAALLARAVSTGGADPMRSFPFLVESGGPARVQALFGAPLAPDALDPAAPTDKGRLVWWHENLVAAVDATGFCAFSSAGLLADGCATLDELAQWILPAELAETPDPAWRALAPGARLFALGASLVLERHALDAHYMADRTSGARALLPRALGALAAPGMLDEYRAWRGLEASGVPSARALALRWTPAAARGLARASQPSAGARELLEERRGALPQQRGALELRASGALERALAAASPRGVFSLALPCSLRDALEAIAGEHAALAGQLVREGELVPSVWRDGRRLAPEDLVLADDALDLVTAIAGG